MAHIDGAHHRTMAVLPPGASHLGLRGPYRPSDPGTALHPLLSLRPAVHLDRTGIDRPAIAKRTTKTRGFAPGFSRCALRSHTNAARAAHKETHDECLVQFHACHQQRLPQAVRRLRTGRLRLLQQLPPAAAGYCQGTVARIRPGPLRRLSGGLPGGASERLPAGLPGGQSLLPRRLNRTTKSGPAEMFAGLLSLPINPPANSAWPPTGPRCPQW